MSRVMFALGTALRETGQVLDRVGCTMQGSSVFRELISKHKTVRGVYDKVPRLPSVGFIAPSASVMGDVTIGENSSIWYGAVLRGDVNGIVIGRETNIQDNAVVHVAKTNVGGRSMPTTIGNRVTIGHNAILHACVIHDDAFVGMGATVMDGAVVEQNAMVAAGALVTPGVVVPSGQVRPVRVSQISRLPVSSPTLVTVRTDYGDCLLIRVTKDVDTFSCKKTALGRVPRAVHAEHDPRGKGVHGDVRGDLRRGLCRARGGVREEPR
jgi:gamma-carbonic anhydrase